MSLKYKIVTTVMLGAGTLLGGCWQKGVVIGKADNKVVITSLENPTDTTVIEFSDCANGYEYYKRINVGDTLRGRRLEWNTVCRNYVSDGMGRYDSRISRINGRYLYEIQRAEADSAKRKNLQDQVRQIMEKSQSR